MNRKQIKQTREGLIRFLKDKLESVHDADLSDVAGMVSQAQYLLHDLENRLDAAILERKEKNKMATKKKTVKKGAKKTTKRK